MTLPRQPRLTVDVIIEIDGGVVLVERAFPPLGWALPGGFVDWGETLEQAAAREVLEETGLELADLVQFRAYSDPRRDPRGHTVSMVFTARPRHAGAEPVGGDDAKSARVFPLSALPELAFDHRAILDDYARRVAGP